MLGQEDTKTVEATDDPRSYVNKSPQVRMAVIAAGVLFNVISALIVFVTVFLIGINRIPAVIGGVEPNLPAAIAGLRAGDEVVEIDGKISIPLLNRNTEQIVINCHGGSVVDWKPLLKLVLNIKKYLRNAVVSVYNWLKA